LLTKIEIELKIGGKLPFILRLVEEGYDNIHSSNSGTGAGVVLVPTGP
ncbi:hypothetical protein DOY81_001718, partial [Sarcophaga bullata]